MVACHGGPEKKGVPRSRLSGRIGPGLLWVPDGHVAAFPGRRSGSGSANLPFQMGEDQMESTVASSLWGNFWIPAFKSSSGKHFQILPLPPPQAPQPG